MKRFTYLVSILAILLLVFIAGKTIFLVYNSAIEPFAWGNWLGVIRSGLSMDISTISYILVLPWLVCLATLWAKRFPLRKALALYLCLVGFVVTLTIGTDCVMYAFWKFKLNAVIFAYIDTSEAGSSTTTWFIVSRIGSAVIGMLLTCFMLLRLTPKQLEGSKQPKRDALMMFGVALLLVLGMRGGWGKEPMSVGRAYYSPKLFLNHAAVNPVYSICSSFTFNDKYADDYVYLSDEECDEMFASLFPADDSDVQDTLLNTQRPNVLVVFMESFGGTFIKELGGAPDVAPNLSRIIKEGIFWDNYYSTSFRTDRGTVSAYSGWTSYPTVSLMTTTPEKLPGIPSIGETLAREGYSTTYIYGGKIEVMGKLNYLKRAGYKTTISKNDFSTEELGNDSWGANDELTAMRCLQTIADMPADQPWHMALQTINSHEPWIVPYHRLDNEVYNAFAYTDHCVGMLVDSLKTLPAWDNTLVIIIPDHGIPYGITYENPEFFHSPMIWTGGAVREPRVMHTLMSQSDIAATLMAQMGLPHDQFPWSRNVLSKNYTNPFVYGSFPAGIMLKDETGTTIFDVTADRAILETPAPNADRIRKAQAILQTSYRQLDDM